MLTKDISIEKDLYLSGGELIGKVRRIFNKYKVKDLPIIENGLLKGYVRTEDLIGLREDETIEKVNFLHSNAFFLTEDAHVLSCLRLMIRRQLSTCAVFKESGNFVGTVVDRYLLKEIGHKFQFGERGAILVLSFDKSQFLISDVLRVLETEGGFPLMSFFSLGDNQDEIHLTVKLQILDNQNIINSLNRFGIKILYSMEVPDYAEFLSDRYDQLIKYLDI
ncbi:MAG: CBS domain-containing protein [Saprospirales bacterium]|nr:MAG: CBS domain-containing protein [Saprospirales bacterium]